MNQQKIDPQSVTKPIQLLAAWLVGLILLNAGFLGAAATIQSPPWVPGLLVVAAVLNVPVFIGAIFLLQTKFRPEMQEDSYYAKYLEVQQQTGKINNPLVEIAGLRTEVYEVNAKLVSSVESVQEQLALVTTTLSTMGAQSRVTQQGDLAVLSAEVERGRERLADTRTELDWARYRIAINDLLPTFDLIREDLSRHGITHVDTFGSTSRPPEKPAVFVLSIGADVPVSYVQEIIRICLRRGLEAIAFAAGDADISRGRIYIGAYTYRHNTITRLSDNIVQGLLNADSRAEMEAIIKQHGRREALP